jgi:hypothetical protein
MSRRNILESMPSVNTRTRREEERLLMQVVGARDRGTQDATHPHAEADRDSLVLPERGA